MKPLFNFFTSGTCVKYVGNQIMILIVHYFDSSDHKGTHEWRLSGGTIQFDDILTGLEKSIRRIGLDNEKFLWLKDAVRNLISEHRKKVDGMPNKTNYEKIAIRNEFVNYLNLISEVIEPVVYKSEHIKIIENETKLATLRRELMEETATTYFQDAIECGFLERFAGHIQYPFLVLGSDAPEKYTGSSDPDIEWSEWHPLSEVCDNLYKNHRPFLNNTLSSLEMILNYEKDKQVFVDQIKACLKPN